MEWEGRYYTLLIAAIVKTAPVLGSPKELYQNKGQCEGPTPTPQILVYLKSTGDFHVQQGL